MQNVDTLKQELSQSLGEALRTPGWWLAKTISVVFSPPILGLVGLYFIGHELNVRSAWLWNGFYAVAGVFLPVAYVLYLMRKGEVTDFHMRDRLERIKPMKAFLLFSSLTSLIFWAGSAPYILQALAFVGVLQSAVMLLITLRWKISGHGAGAAGFSALLWGLNGSAAAPAFLILPLVIWARVYLERHDLAQTLAGAMAGFGFMAVWFAMVANVLTLRFTRLLL